MQAPIKIGFVLLSRSEDPIPSTRIAVLNMLPYLRAAQFDPHIVFEPARNTETPDVSRLAARFQAQGFQLIYFQKVHGPSVLVLAGELRAAGIKTVYGVCDVVKPEMVEATDATVTVTDYLRSLYPVALQPKMHTVHDGIERPAVHKTEWATHCGSRARPLRAVLVTSVALDRVPVLIDPPSWLHVNIVGRYAVRGKQLQRLREARWQMTTKPGLREKWDFLRFLAHSRVTRTAWDAEGVYAALQAADIGIIPIETDPAHGAMPGWQVKSENRLTLKMSIGLPVVATPIPSYEPVVQQGHNAFLARSRAEWLTYLSALRDPALRRSIGEQGRAAALAHYSMERQAEKLVKVLRGLVASG